MTKTTLLVAALLALALTAPAAAQDNFAVKDATGATITKASKKLGDGSQADKNVMIDSAGVEKGTVSNPQSVAIVGTPAVSVSNFPSSQAVSVATLPALATGGNVIGSIANSGFAATQSGAWNITNITGTVSLPTGAATAANQATGNTSLATIATNTAGLATAARQDSLLAALGSPLQAGGKVDTVIAAAATDRGAIVGTTAVTLIPANPARRGYRVQVQAANNVSCYVNGQAAATADFHSLMIPGGALYETPPTHVDTGAVSIVCSAAGTSVYAREY